MDVGNALTVCSNVPLWETLGYCPDEIELIVYEDKEKIKEEIKADGDFQLVLLEPDLETIEFVVDVDIQQELQEVFEKNRQWAIEQATKKYGPLRKYPVK